MNIYESLLQLRSDLEQLNTYQTLSIKAIEQCFIHAMKNKMIFNYQEILSKYDEIDEDVIASFDQNTILAFFNFGYSYGSLHRRYTKS